MNWKTQTYPELFFRNPGQLPFVEEAATRGVADIDGGSHGAVWADLDNDGDFDLVNGTTLAPEGNPAPNDIFRNDGTRFARATPSALMARLEATRGVAVFDADKDGDLDIFTVSGYKGDGDPPGERNEFYLNQMLVPTHGSNDIRTSDTRTAQSIGELGFVASGGGVLEVAPVGQGVTDTDFDMDGDIDLLVANRRGPVRVLENDGRGTFVSVSPESLGIHHRAGDGVSTGDVNGDGRLDVLLTSNDEGHLYLGTSAGQFRHSQSFENTEGYMGGFADLDCDGDLDLVFAGDDVIYINDGEGRFAPGPSLPTGALDDPRAIAFADIDADGDLDFALGVKRTPNALIRNVGAPGGHWLKVRLTSPQGQAGAFGAKVWVRVAVNDAPGASGVDAIVQDGQGGETGRLLGFREAHGAHGYLAQDDPVLHVGTGAHTRVDLEVRFLDGEQRRLYGVPVDQVVHVK